MSNSKSTMPSKSSTTKKPAPSTSHSSKPSTSKPSTSTTHSSKPPSSKPATSTSQSSKPSSSKPSTSSSRPTKPSESLLKSVLKPSAPSHASKPSASTSKPSTSTSHASGLSTSVLSLKEEAASLQKMILDIHNDGRKQLEKYCSSGIVYFDKMISETNRQADAMSSVMIYMNEGTAILVVKLLKIHRKNVMRLQGEQRAAIMEVRKTGKSTWKPDLDITTPNGTIVTFEKLCEAVKEVGKAGLFDTTENQQKLKSVAKEVVEILTAKKLI